MKGTMRTLITLITFTVAGMASAGGITNAPTEQRGDCIEDGKTVWCGDDDGNSWWCDESVDSHTWLCYSEITDAEWETDCPECSPPRPRGDVADRAVR